MDKDIKKSLYLVKATAADRQGNQVTQAELVRISGV
jgi:hypothetical protein